MEFDSYVVMECDPINLLADEYRMIAALQPEQNKLGRKPSNGGELAPVGRLEAADNA